MNNAKRRNLFQAGGLYHLLYDQGFSGHSPEHSHDFYQMTIVQTGRITQTYGKKSWAQLPGDIFFAIPGMKHSLFVYGNDTIYYAFSFSEKILRRALESVPGTEQYINQQCPFFSITKNQYDVLINSLALLRNWPEHDTIDTFTCGCHISTAIVVLLLEALKSTHEKAEQPSNPLEMIMRTRVFIDQHYNEDIKLDSLIKMSKMSKTSFCNYFVQSAGATPKQYITEKRMREALRLIQETNNSITSIAEQVGYSEFSTFFRNFYRMTGCSPSDFRAAHQQDNIRTK